MKKKDKNRKTIEAYNKNSQFYATRFDSYGIRSDDIDRALKFNKSNSKKVLELGCGNGRDAEYIISRVGYDNYIGIDASNGLIEIARQKNLKGTFYLKDLFSFFEEEGEWPKSFGVIFAFYSMLHMERQELSEIINSCHNVLNLGGVLYISSKYGDYREIEIENLGSKKYYYSYKPEDLENMIGDNFETVYKVIHDSDYGPSFTIALRKIK